MFIIILTGSRKRGHISLMLASLHWVSLKSRIFYELIEDENESEKRTDGGQLVKCIDV